MIQAISGFLTATAIDGSPLAAMLSVPIQGDYFSLPKIILMLALIAPWLYVAPWVHKDVKLVKAPRAAWCTAVVGGGGVGVLVWMLVPVYFVGLLLYLVLAGTILASYVVYRNSKVEQKAKVLTGSHIASLFGREDTEEEQVVTHVKLYSYDGRNILPPDETDSPTAERHAYNMVQGLLHDILWRRASQADVSPSGQRSRVRFVVDGVVVKRPSMALAESEAVVQYLKGPAEMDEEDRRRPQRGRITVDLAGSPIDMDLISAGTTGGQRMQFRIVQEAIRTELTDLGMSPDILERVVTINLAGSGIVIVSAPQGNGMTSTLYSMLRKQDAFIKQLETMEADPDVDLENIAQHEYGDAAKLPAQLASVLRRDPDVVLLDQCPDGETAGLVCEAADEKMFLIGMQANDSFVALARWVRRCGEAEKGVKHLRAILCQMLLRKLCPNCREAYRPDPKRLAKLNLPADVQKLYRPPTRPLTDQKGNPITCPTCQGNGYLGRCAAFELLEVTDEVRELVASDAPIVQIKAACRKNKMLYLQEQAVRKVIEGITGFQEVARVTKQAKQ